MSYVSMCLHYVRCLDCMALSVSVAIFRQSLSTPGAWLLVGGRGRGLYYLVTCLFIVFCVSHWAIRLECNGWYRGTWNRGLMAGLWVGAGQLDVWVPWDAIAVAASSWLLGHLTLTCNKGVILQSFVSILLLWRRANVLNVNFITCYGGQFTFST